MKKLISVLAAVCVLAVNTSVFASPSAGSLETDTGVQGVRNNVSSLANTVQETSIPCFRPGDVLKFDVSGVTSGNTLTLISYKEGTETGDLGNNNIQYIDQYVLASENGEEDESTTYTVNYTIRDIDEGIYKIMNSGNDNSDIATFYYKVGDPKVELLKGTDETTYYTSKGNSDGSYSIAFIGKVKLGSSDVSLTDVGIENVGFKFTSDANTYTTTKDATAVQNANQASIESEGSITYYYGLTMYGLEENDLSNLGFSVEAIENGTPTTAEEGGNN